MNVETLLTQHIEPIGGVHLRTIVGDSPSFENADFFFRSDNVVAELKSLDEDKIVDDDVIKKATELYLEEARSDFAVPILFGEIHATTAGRSESFIKKIASLYEKPLKALVEKANRQIRNTKTALGTPDAHGLLIVANNRHSALDPSHARHLLGRILGRQTYSSINSVIYMSAGQQVQLPQIDRQVDVFLEIRRASLPPCAPLFIERFRGTWFSCLAHERGYTEYQAMEADEHILFQLTNRQ